MDCSVRLQITLEYNVRIYVVVKHGVFRSIAKRCTGGSTVRSVAATLGQRQYIRRTRCGAKGRRASNFSRQESGRGTFRSENARSSGAQACRKSETSERSIC